MTSSLHTVGEIVLRNSTRSSIRIGAVSADLAAVCDTTRVDGKRSGS